MRSRHLLLAPIVLLWGACSSTEPKAEPRPVPQIVARQVPRHDAQAFYTTVSIFGASFSADGTRLLITSDETGVYNVFSVPVAGGNRTQLTYSTTNAMLGIDWFPADDRFLVTADQAGDELNHIFVRELDGQLVDLTPGEGLKASFRGWADDDLSFFAVTNERDPKHFDLYRYFVGAPQAVEASALEEIASGYRRRLVWTNPGGYEVGGVSRDGEWIALTKVRNNADSDVFVRRADAPPGELLHVTPHAGDIDHRFASFAPDGSKVFYSSNEGGEFDRIWSYDLETAERGVVFEDDWDVMSYRFSENGKFLITSVNVDAHTVERVFEVESGDEVRLPDVPEGAIEGVVMGPFGDYAAFYVESDTQPPDLHVFDRKERRLSRLTDAMNPDIRPEDLVEAQVVRYPSFDDLQIPTLLYRPHQASAESPVPALVWVHGGPGGQSRKGYVPTIQHLVNHGYAVIAVNNRGSSGYGKTFHHMDDRRHGDVDLMDCVFARRYLEGLDWIDGQRVGIIGGSYGGYMVCAALAFEPGAFDVGIDIFGVTNWVRTLESIPPWWEEHRQALYDEMGDPAVDGDRLHARSPLFHASKITAPLLVVQGANDPRVLKAESDEIVAAVRESGVPVKYVVFPDEGHGFRSRKNRVAASQAYLEFLKEHM